MEHFQYYDVDHRGRIDRITYVVAGIKKTANVYVPYGYDAAEPYNVLYVIHGGAGSEDSWLDSACTKNMLDRSIDSGRIRPLLVVFPTYYLQDKREVGAPVERNWEGRQTELFQKELRECLIPAVESRYHTYAETVSEAGLKASRDHRGLTGFSMGGSTTWYGFIHNLDVISKFAPLSGDCWAIEPAGGRTHPEETAKLLKETVDRFGFAAKDFLLYPTTGTKDIAYPNLTPQVEAMLRLYPETFVEGVNFHYEAVPGLEHNYEAVKDYLYDLLPKLFKKGPVTKVLPNGIRIPEIGMGMWDAHGEDAVQAAIMAMEEGYRLIDTAAYYHNEDMLGRAIREATAKGIVSRQDLFITSKVWYTEMEPGALERSFQASLEKLGLDYLDLFLLHWPLRDVQASWKILERLYEQGLVRAIGVSNYQIHHLKAMESYANIKPMVNQIESHPKFQQDKLVRYCQEAGIPVEVWGPLGKGKDLAEPVIVKLAEKYGKSPAQIILRWHLQRGVIVIPKSIHRERLHENLDLYDFSLTDEEMAAIYSLETGVTTRGYQEGYTWK